MKPNGFLSSSIGVTFDRGLQHHKSGWLQEAERLYRMVVASDPRHTDGLHLLGIVAHQSGRHEEGHRSGSPYEGRARCGRRDSRRLENPVPHVALPQWPVGQE